MKSREYVEAILSLVEAGNDPMDVLQKVQIRLKKRGHEKLYPSILKILAQKIEGAQSKNKTLVKVASKKQLHILQAEIESTLSTFQSDTEYDVIEDSTIIGGFLLSSQNKIIDKTYKTQLVNLYRAIVN